MLMHGYFYVNSSFSLYITYNCVKICSMRTASSADTDVSVYVQSCVIAFHCYCSTSKGFNPIIAMSARQLH